MELSRVYCNETPRSCRRTHSPVVRSARIRCSIFCWEGQKHIQPNQGRISEAGEDRGHHSRSRDREQMYQETREVLSVDLKTPVNSKVDNPGRVEEHVVLSRKFGDKLILKGQAHCQSAVINRYFVSTLISFPKWGTAVAPIKNRLRSIASSNPNCSTFHHSSSRPLLLLPP